MTPEEREGIINEIIERIYLRLPEIIGNLITNHALKLRLSREFYEKYPDLKDHKTIVASVMERMEAADPSKPIELIMRDAVPEIRRQLKNLKNLNMTEVRKPNLDHGIGEI